MAQLTKLTDVNDSALVIEAGKGKVTFNYRDTTGETTVNINSLPLPLRIPASQGLKVDGSSILFYKAGATPTDGATNYTYDRVAEGTGTNGPAVIGENNSMTIYGGSGTINYFHEDTTSGAIMIDTNMPIDELNFPFEVSLPSGLSGTQQITISPLGSSVILTSAVI